MFDFDFFAVVAQHPKLNVKNAVQTLDILAKACLYDDVFGPYSFRPFVLLANRFREDPAFVAFILKLAKVMLTLHPSAVRFADLHGQRKKGRPRQSQQAASTSPSSQFEERGA